MLWNTVLGALAALLSQTLLLGTPTPSQSRKAPTLPPLGDDPAPKSSIEHHRSIEITGSAEFRHTVREHIDAFGRTEVGKKVLAEIAQHARAGRTVKIEFATTSAEVVPVDPPKAFPRSASIGPDGRVKVATPGEGSDVRIAYDPDYKRNATNALTKYEDRLGPRIREVYSCLTEEVTLGHELIHALHGLQGRNLKNFEFVDATGMKTNHEEASAAGIGPYANDPLTEQAIRREQRVPARTSYMWLCPNPPDLKKLNAPSKTSGVNSALDAINR